MSVLEIYCSKCGAPMPDLDSTQSLCNRDNHLGAIAHSASLLSKERNNLQDAWYEGEKLRNQIECLQAEADRYRAALEKIKTKIEHNYAVTGDKGDHVRDHLWVWASEALHPTQPAEQVKLSELRGILKDEPAEESEK